MKEKKDYYERYLESQKHRYVSNFSYIVQITIELSSKENLTKSYTFNFIQNYIKQNYSNFVIFTFLNNSFFFEIHYLPELKHYDYLLTNCPSIKIIKEYIIEKENTTSDKKVFFNYYNHEGKYSKQII